MSMIRLHDLSIKYKLMLFTGLAIVGTAVVFGFLNYRRQRSALLRGIDEKLMTCTYLAEQVPPEGYFGRIDNAQSVSQDQYDALVAKQNRLCRELGLQYLWSCMLIDGDIVFTTATSPSKDVTKRDYAQFFEVHRDPHAFDDVFRTMRPVFSSFHNEWGHGRMVLVPRIDSRGRKYCFGASVSIDEVGAILQRTLWHSVLLTVAILLSGLVVSSWVSVSLSRPLIRLTRMADHIAQGDLTQNAVEERGGAEVHSLSRSLAQMKEAIAHTIEELRHENRARQAAQQKLQRHRDRLEQTVTERTAALERSNQQLERFAYITSHDLQEPLRTIESFSDLLQRDTADKLSADAREYLDYIRGAVQRLRAMVEGLLAYSRVDTQGQAFQKVPCENAVRGALDNLKVSIDESGTVVRYGELPLVYADPAQLTQLFQNLLSNAIKFHGDSPPQVWISASREADEWVIACRDNGIGIDPKYSGKIFEIFQRLHARDKYPGTGIGLAFCRHIVDRHGGRIWVESKEGEGATFYFTLPLCPDDVATAVGQAS